MRSEYENRVADGGIMTVQPITQGTFAEQLIYLDFDGELTRYNGELLTIDDVTVEDSGLTEERISQITQALNDRFVGQNVLFVSDRSDLSGQSDYSTIYIGKTSSFAPYGTFAGLAETVDSGNKIHNDNAFVMLDSLSSNDRIADVIAHEAGHLLGTLDHGGECLEKYGYYQTYIVSSGVTSTGITLYLDTMFVTSGGVANSTTADSGGLTVSRGGVVNSTTINTGGLEVSSGGVANSTNISSGGRMYIFSGGVANSTNVNSGGSVYISSGGMVSGSLQIKYGATVSAYQGAIIDFTVAEQANPGTALINVWILISGRNDATYTLTVKAEQADGTYVLASCAATFEETIMVKTTDDAVLGTVTEGEPLITGGKLYTLAIQDGLLSLNIETMMPITITADSASKRYDGTALTTSGYTYSGTLAEGDELIVTVSGSQTDAGIGVTTVASYKVMRGKKDVTDSYTFNDSVDGTLTVTKRNVTLTSMDAEKIYDGTPLTCHEVEVSGDSFAEGEGAEYTFTGSQTEVGSSENTFSYTLKDGTKADNYNITTENGTLTVTKRTDSITITADSASKMYDGTALTASGYTYSGALAEGDQLVVTVEGSITDAGTAENVVTSYKVMRGETDVTANYTFAQSISGKLEVTKRNVTLLSNSNSKVYDGEALAGIVSVGGNGFVEGEATASAESITDAGSKINSITISKGAGYKDSNYNISKTEGTLTVTKRNVTLLSNSNSKVYDGEALAGIVSVGGNGFVEGEATASAESITDAGSRINSITISKGAGYKDSNYNISKTEGTLTVTKRDVTLISGNAEKVYDGTPLTNHDISVSGSGWVNGDGASYTFTGSQTNVGTSDNTFTYTLNNGTKADNYDITRKYGILEVSAPETVITITAESASRKYDGTELTAGFSYTGKLIEGDELVVTVTGSVTNVGTCVSSIASYKVMRGEINVTSNYTFGTCVNGMLEVTKRNVTLTSRDAEKVYDGTALTCHEADVSGDGFVSGEGAEYTFTGSQTEVGTCKNTFSYTLQDNTKAENYNIRTVEGDLTVTKPVAAKSDVDGNGVSDVMFQFTGGDYQIGFWMNGTNTWQGQGIAQDADFKLIGAYDMDASGTADALMIGSTSVFGHQGTFVGYYLDGTGSQWTTIGFLDNPGNIQWENVVGNLTGKTGANSIVWQAPELGALGIWTDGTANWVSLGSGYDSSWTMLGCGDFDGNGKDEVLFTNAGNLYTIDIDSNFASLGGWGTDWEVKTIGDFAGDGQDDIILQNGNMIVKFNNGKADDWASIGAMDASDWFIVGAGDYNGDQQDDLLVRQYSTGMLGYYTSGDMSQWNELGRGVDMNWTVIA